MLEAQLESLIWSLADGRGTDHEWELLHADERASLRVLDRLLFDAEEDLNSVRGLAGEERDQVIADFTETVEGLKATLYRLRPPPPAPPVQERSGQGGGAAHEDIEPGEVQLQASWSSGLVVVWAAGRGTAADDNEALATRLETIGGPPVGWQLHAGVPLNGDQRAEAVSIPLRDALGWLVALGGGQAHDGVGDSVRWLGRAALEGVRLAVRGSVVPSLRVARRPNGGPVDASVRWVPALLDNAVVGALSTSMPGPVAALTGGGGRATATAVMAAAVEAIVSEAVERMELPAVPPTANTQRDLDDSVIALMDGTTFAANPTLAAEMSRRMDQWTRSVTDPARSRLIVKLEPPAPGGVWLLSVFVLGENGALTSIDAALRGEAGRRTVSGEWRRLLRLMPSLERPGQTRRGQVALSQDQAWHFMSVTGPKLADIGFDVRAPELSRRKARPSLRLFAETVAGSVVGAHQLSNVAWSVLFDDVELTAAEVKRLAAQARPLVQSNGKWIEVDRVDLEQAAAALAARESVTQMTGAEILRHSVGLDGAGLSGGVVVDGNSWANDIVRRAGDATMSPVTEPEGFTGTLRAYQAEAVAWIGFLEAAGLGGCLALDMGLGKTPTVLAHLARAAQAGKRTLVVAPAAVVGNWAAEAARFTSAQRVLVHHGADRNEGAVLRNEMERADIVITTYATAVRDLDELEAIEWHNLVLDEAQAIKNPASDTAQQLRRLNAHTKLALTGTPIENGLGDLWAILDFTNPGLVGSRPSFIAQMAGDGDAALRALNGILLFRRTKSEPEVARELPDKIDELDHCTMTPEQIGLYQAVLDELVANVENDDGEVKQGAILAAITALKQICNHPSAYRDDGMPLAGRSGKLARLEEIVESVFAAGERILVFTHFASWGRKLADHLSTVTGTDIACYDGSLARGVRDKLVAEFQAGRGAGALVLSLKAGGTGLNLTAANHVVLYDRWWNPAVEDQARDRAWRIGQSKTVISHRLVCPGTIDERVEEVVAGKRHIANLVLPKSSSLADLSTDQLRQALGLRPDELLEGDE